MGYALTAGLTVREALAAPPGMIMTLYLQRRDYDDALHGVRRKSIAEWSDD